MRFDVNVYKDIDKKPIKVYTRLMFLKGPQCIEEYINTLSDSGGNKFIASPDHPKFDFISKAKEGIEVIINS